MKPLALLRVVLRRLAVCRLRPPAAAAAAAAAAALAAPRSASSDPPSSSAAASTGCIHRLTSVLSMLSPPGQRWRAELLYGAYIICCSYVLSLLDTHLYPLR